MRIRGSYLSDILVSDSADLLDVGSALGDTLKGVTEELELILDIGGGHDLNTGLACEASDVLLTQEVTELEISLTASRKTRNLNGINMRCLRSK